MWEYRVGSVIVRHGAFLLIRFDRRIRESWLVGKPFDAARKGASDIFTLDIFHMFKRKVNNKTMFAISRECYFDKILILDL